MVSRPRGVSPSEELRMRVRIRWSSIVVLSSTSLLMLLGAACGADVVWLRGTTIWIGRRSCAACDRSDQDTTHYLHLPLYRACAVTIAARRMANDMRPEFWSRPVDQNCLSALVEVAVSRGAPPEDRVAERRLDSRPPQACTFGPRSVNRTPHGGLGGDKNSPELRPLFSVFVRYGPDICLSPPACRCRSPSWSSSSLRHPHPPPRSRPAWRRWTRCWWEAG